MPYTFKIDAGYPTFEISEEGIVAVRKGKVKWDELDDFIADHYPASTYSGGAMTVKYGKQFPGRPYLRCTGISAAPLTNKTLDLDSNDDYKHEWWSVTLNYKFLKNQPQTGGGGSSANDPKDPVPFLVHRASIGSEVYQLDNQGLVWDNIANPNLNVSQLPDTPSQRQLFAGVVAGQEVKRGPRMVVHLIEHEITWQRVPRPPFTAIRSCQGKVNHAEQSFKTGKIPLECLLFNGANWQCSTFSNGEQSWELVYRFSERQVVAMDQVAPGGWNHFYRSLTSSKISGLTPTTGTYTSACTGRPGFYRLERSFGRIGGCLDPNLVDNRDSFLGYNGQSAIFQKADFGTLFTPEPIPPTPGP